MYSQVILELLSVGVRGFAGGANSICIARQAGAPVAGVWILSRCIKEPCPEEEKRNTPWS
jgi:hypothetical protein